MCIGLGDSYRAFDLGIGCIYIDRLTVLGDSYRLSGLLKDITFWGFGFYYGVVTIDDILEGCYTVITSSLSINNLIALA